jgi:hypothetical protein
MPGSVRLWWLGLFAAALVLGISGCGTVVRSPRGQGGADLVVQDFCGRFGRQKGFAIVSLFADNARFDLVGVGVSFVGRDDIARLADYGVAAHGRLVEREAEVALDTVRCRLEESNDWLRLLGVNHATYDGRFLVSRGKIAGAQLELTPDSREELAGKLAGFLAWLLARDPEVLQRLLPGGRPVYDSRFVPELISHLRQWRSQAHP